VNIFIIRLSIGLTSWQSVMAFNNAEPMLKRLKTAALAIRHFRTHQARAINRSCSYLWVVVLILNVLMAACAWNLRKWLVTATIFLFWQKLGLFFVKSKFFRPAMYPHQRWRYIAVL
jgi:hypothetical protein